jgi:uncharacterized RDD family membrane protein YckC
VARWRDVKHGKVEPQVEKKVKSKPKETKPKKEKPKLAVGEIAPTPNRMKAFIVDMFMIMMPILYLLTYVFLDGKDDYQGSTIAQFVGVMLFGFIESIFLVKSGQTPGMKAYEIKVVHTDTGENLGFIQAFWRYISFLVSGTFVIGLFFPFVRDDKKSLHDLLSKSRLIVHRDDKSS